jgi:hypothetical protein
VNVGFLDAAELDDMKGRGQRHSEGVKEKVDTSWKNGPFYCYGVLTT